MVSFVGFLLARLCYDKTFFKPGGNRVNQATSYDIENTSLQKPNNIIQIQQQDTISVIISERNTQLTIHFLCININYLLE